MKIPHIVLFMALCAPFVAAASSKVSHEADRAAIDAAYSAWVKAVNAKNIEAWMTFLAPNPKSYAPDTAALLDRDAIRAFYVDLFRDPKFNLRCRQHHVEVAASGDVAWSLGACESTFTDKDGRLGHATSKWVKVWKKQSSGEWKCEVNCWNYDPLK